MALKAVVQDIGTIPEANRALYVERDGMHWLDVEAVENGGKRWALEDVGGLKTALQTERDAREKAAKALAEFGDLTPQKARDALAAAERVTKAGESEAAKWKERESALATEYLEKLKADKKPLEDTIAELESDLHEKLIGSEIHKHLAGAAIPESMPLLYGYLERQCAVVKNRDGKREAVAVDASGKPRVSMKAGSADYMSVAELVESARPMFPHCFLGDGASGSGSSAHGSANNNGGGGVRRIPRSDQKAINDSWQDIATGKAVVV